MFDTSKPFSQWTQEELASNERPEGISDEDWAVACGLAEHINQLREENLSRPELESRILEYLEANPINWDESNRGQGN